MRIQFLSGTKITYSLNYSICKFCVAGKVPKVEISFICNVNGVKKICNPCLLCSNCYDPLLKTKVLMQRLQQTSGVYNLPMAPTTFQQRLQPSSGVFNQPAGSKPYLWSSPNQRRLQTTSGVYTLLLESTDTLLRVYTLQYMWPLHPISSVYTLPMAPTPYPYRLHPTDGVYTLPVASRTNQWRLHPITGVYTHCSSGVQTPPVASTPHPWRLHPTSSVFTLLVASSPFHRSLHPNSGDCILPMKSTPFLWHLHPTCGVCNRLHPICVILTLPALSTAYRWRLCPTCGVIEIDEVHTVPLFTNKAKNQFKSIFFNSQPLKSLSNCSSDNIMMDLTRVI